MSFLKFTSDEPLIDDISLAYTRIYATEISSEVLQKLIAKFGQPITESQASVITAAQDIDYVNKHQLR